MASPPEFKKSIHQALRAWQKTDYNARYTLEELLLVQGEREKLSNYADPDSIHLAVNRVLLESFSELGNFDKLLEDILRKRFLEQCTSRQVGHQFNLSEDSINRRQAQAIDLLADIIWQREQQARLEKANALHERLPPQTYSRLFGVEDFVNSLETQLLSTAEPWVISLTGIGGIGKTAIADQAARRIISCLRFKQIAFVRADPASMSGQSESPQRTFEQIMIALTDALDVSDRGPDRGTIIRRHLKANPSLIIIDNIEKADDAAYLLHHLADWANPTKFLITSRARPISTQAAKVISLNGLSPENALALVRYEASLRGMEEIATASDQQLAPLHKTIGGNPLALKLAVALLEIMPLPVILSDFRHGRTHSTVDMYKHIYWKAWNSLHPEAQSLLEAMPLVGEAGGSQEQLQAITKLSDAQLWQAIQELSTRCLLELRGTVWERRYGIHRLTETFLNTEVIGWNDHEQGD